MCSGPSYRRIHRVAKKRGPLAKICTRRSVTKSGQARIIWTWQFRNIYEKGRVGKSIRGNPKLAPDVAPQRVRHHVLYVLYRFWSNRFWNSLILSGFRDDFQRRMTWVAFSIRCAKTNSKIAENSESCENYSILFNILFSIVPFFSIFFSNGSFIQYSSILFIRVLSGAGAAAAGASSPPCPGSGTEKLLRRSVMRGDLRGGAAVRGDRLWSSN